MSKRYIALAIFVILLFAFFLFWFLGKPISETPQPLKKLNKWDGRQMYIRAVDSTKMAEKAKYRRALDSISAREDVQWERIQRVSDRLTKIDKEKEKEYHKAPSVPLADEVIRSKNTLIDTLKKSNQIGMAQLALEKRKLANADSAVAISRQTVDELNQAYSELNESMKKLKNKKWVVGASVTHGYTPSLRRETVVGISITRKILQF